MLACSGDISGLAVLDIGCGEGRFGRMLAERGAVVTGLDPCAPLIAAAQDRSPTSLYTVGGAENLPFRDRVFDAAIMYLVLIDVFDFRKAIREAHRVLREGGRLVVANIISFRSACELGWIKDDNGERLYVAVNNYFEEKANHAAWCGISVTNYHRPAQAYFQAFIDAGFRLAAYHEPAPSAELAAEQPGFAAENRVPYFDVHVWVRQAPWVESLAK